MTAGLFEQENLSESAKKAKEKSKQIRRHSGGSKSGDQNDTGGEVEDIFKEEVPPFVEEE